MTSQIIAEDAVIREPLFRPEVPATSCAADSGCHDDCLPQGGFEDGVSRRSETSARLQPGCEAGKCVLDSKVKV